MSRHIPIAIFVLSLFMASCTQREKTVSADTDTAQTPNHPHDPSETEAKNEPAKTQNHDAAEANTDNASARITIPEKCTIPDAPNPIPIEQMRPLILSFETYAPDTGVSVKVNARIKIDTEMEDGILLAVLKDYKFYAEVDCDGDGIYEDKYHKPSRYLGNVLECVYPKKGIHQMRIRGEIPQMYATYDLPDDEDDDYLNEFDLISVDQWGDIRWKSMERFFENRYSNRKVKINAQDTPNLMDVCDMSRMFYAVPNFNASIERWDTSHIENMDLLFVDAINLDQDLSQWNISSLRSAEEIFGNPFAEVICPKCDAFREKLYNESKNRPENFPLALSDDLFREDQLRMKNEYRKILNTPIPM